MANKASRITAQEAKRVLAQRELARRHLVDFSEFVDAHYRAARHHKLVGEYLEQVELYIRTKGAEGIGRLLILEPPRHGKSQQATIHFPAWVLGKNPNARVIIASYGGDLATKFSRQAREVVLSDRYREIFGELASGDSPVELAEDSRSVKAWDLASPHRGGVMAAGVGGGITGSGAHLLIVDDPFKNREEAESQDLRDSVWGWWTSTAYTRLEDGSAVVGMLTRWHGDDWAGRLIKEMAKNPKADHYTILCLPAIWEEPAVPEGKTFAEYQREKMLEGVYIEEKDALGREPGEALWLEKYSVEDLERIRENVKDYDFEALYQQHPYSREGNLFKREWFTIVDAPPAIDEVVLRMWFWDKAGSQSGKSDYFCGGVLSLTKDELVYVENVVRKQGTPFQRDELMKSSMLADRERRLVQAVWHQQDPGSAGLDSAMATNRMLAKLGFLAMFETVSGSKELRAGPWSSVLQGGGVRLVRGAWNDPFIEEHIPFPKGLFDDQVDMASWGYSKLMDIAATMLPPEDEVVVYDERVHISEF